MIRGANDSIACRFTSIRWNDCKRRECMCGGKSYLAVVQNETEISRDRDERRIGVRGFFDPAEDQLGLSGRSRLLALLRLICSSRVRVSTRMSPFMQRQIPYLARGHDVLAGVEIRSQDPLDLTHPAPLLFFRFPWTNASASPMSSIRDAAGSCRCWLA